MPVPSRTWPSWPLRHAWGTHPMGAVPGAVAADRPWGHILAEQAQEPGVVCAELDARVLTERRNQLPALQTSCAMKMIATTRGFTGTTPTLLG